MHRQSVGSPNSKLLHTHHHHVISSTSSSSLISPKLNDAAPSLKDLAISPFYAADQELDRKTQTSPEKFIHLIPMLIIFCFLILYLSSHDPSIKGDLTNSNGFNAISKPIEIDDFGGLLEVEKGDVLALRSMRNLQEIDKEEEPSRITTHRKFADF